MADFFRDVSNEGWLSRIGSSIKGVLVGGVLVLICVGVLFWNEGRAVKEAKRIEEGQVACVSVDSAKVDPACENKEIHISGDATTTEKPTDDVFGVSASAIRLKRTVEMYQWKEKKETETHKKLGGGEEKVTTYNYEKAWDDDAIDSSDFKHPEGHQNPAKPFPNAIQNASKVMIGAFKLTPRLVEMMEHFTPLAMSADTASLPANIKDAVKVTGSGFYIGADPNSPSIGDARVSFAVVKPGPISVIGLQVGNTFQPFESAHGETLMLSDGIVSADQMFQAAKERNAMITWLVRLGGFVVMWIGLMMLLRPLRVVADVLPFAGELVGFASGLIMLLVAGVVSLVTISIAWLVYRPVLGIGLLVLAGGCVWLIMRAKKRAVPRMPAMQNMPPPPIPS
jgi:hypothetical protein